MHIFVINSGSSSLKYQLFRWPQEQPLARGLVERIGLPDGQLTHTTLQPDGQEHTERHTLPIPDHRTGLEQAMRLLTDPATGVLQNPANVQLVGHRAVHGGEEFRQPTLVTPEVKARIRELFPLAPLHNPANLLGMEVAEQLFPQARQVAVFDTAFHSTLPPHAYRFALPEELYTRHGLRAYGFHGTSHQFVSRETLRYLGQPDARVITVHLGNGCSMAATVAGRAVDTSMGFGPMNGLVMGTRAGDTDQAVIFHLVEQLGYSLDDVKNLLNKESGMLGLTGHSDMRDITRLLNEGDPRARLAYDLYAHRIKKYLGSFLAVLNGADAVVFTGGVGENDALVRQLVCANLDFLGIQLDETENARRAPGIRDLSAAGSRVQVLVVPTNEELEIARLCAAVSLTA
ncbi:acetate/propionate family kinase [Hymenobacter canadensis]|uniref:Acetate kinase n=1 Tax=Hymenobacter canadensis TaxID=2999067 RepID=A0ABY7LP02_9BACT|nr:acetate kinase [Hymenobacter canadensis]WBA42153.1 acetate kinase [Hymenobacter canadensis]